MTQTLTAAEQRLSGALFIQPLHLVVLAIVTLGFSFWPTLATMVHVWNTSDTYAHGWLIPPISIYLLYQMRHRLATIPAEPQPLAIPLALGSGFVWMLAALVDIQIIQQLMFVSLIISVVLLIMGWKWTNTAAFPLGFLYLAVPMGDGLTPYLIEMTADFVVYALRFSGIPVFREGTFFVIPSGSWSVVSGCSGMRYLMATITVGVLFAYLNYRSNRRRVLFVFVAILVAIIANWLRAYGIVMIAHLSDMKLALGVDHYIYGWVFFGIIIFLLMTVGMVWSEEPAPSVSPPTGQLEQRARTYITRSSLVVLVAGLLAVHVWPLIFKAASTPVKYGNPAIDAPSVEGREWQVVAPPIADWRPHFVGNPVLLERAFARDHVVVGVTTAWYPQQSQGEELVHAANELVREKYEPWRVLSTRTQPHNGDAPIRMLETVLVQRSGDKHLLIWQTNWVDGRFTTGTLETKLLEMRSRLRGKGNPGAAVIFYVGPLSTEEIADSRGTLAAVAAEFLPVINTALGNVVRKAQ